MLDYQGNVKERLDYLPFGEELPVGVGGRTAPYSGGVYPSGPDIESQKFTGKERDAETGLDYFGARYMSGAMGRFTSVDPVKITTDRLFDPQQLDLYVYGRNNPLRFVDPNGETLTIAGNLEQIKAQICDIVGTSDCSQRISYDQQTSTITLNLNGIDTSENEGALLLSQLVGSSSTYNLTLGSSFQTAGGTRALTGDTPNQNLANFDDRLGKLTQFQRPPSGVDDIVAIDPSRARFMDTSGRVVSLSSLIFHELAEAYAKIDLGLGYRDADVMSVIGGTVMMGIGGYQGAHMNAVDREVTLRIQRPYIRVSGRAGDNDLILIRDPK